MVLLLIVVLVLNLVLTLGFLTLIRKAMLKIPLLINVLVRELVEMLKVIVSLMLRLVITFLRIWLGFLMILIVMVFLSMNWVRLIGECKVLGFLLSACMDIKIFYLIVGLLIGNN